MNPSRTAIQTFIAEHFKNYELRFKHTITRTTEPHLKYLEVDRYHVEVLSSENFNKLISFVQTRSDAELYFAFGYLCIGYKDRDYGEVKRLDAFVPDLVIDLPYLADKGFVLQDAPAAPQDLDKGLLVVMPTCQ